MAYIPHWERPDSPTTTMTRTEMYAYYKGTNVAHTLELWLADATEMPQAIQDDIRELLQLLPAKEGPAWRNALDRLRRRMMSAYADLHSADVPALTPCTVNAGRTSGYKMLAAIRAAERSRKAANLARKILHDAAVAAAREAA